MEKPPQDPISWLLPLSLGLFAAALLIKLILYLINK